MRVTVDLNLCQTYAQCCSLTPDVFELRGREVLLHVPEPDEAQRLKALRAAAACPVAAILVEREAPRSRPRRPGGERARAHRHRRGFARRPARRRRASVASAQSFKPRSSAERPKWAVTLAIADLAQNRRHSRTLPAKHRIATTIVKRFLQSQIVSSHQKEKYVSVKPRKRPLTRPTQ